MTAVTFPTFEQEEAATPFNQAAQQACSNNHQTKSLIFKRSSCVRDTESLENSQKKEKNVSFVNVVNCFQGAAVSGLANAYRAGPQVFPQGGLSRPE